MRACAHLDGIESNSEKLFYSKSIFVISTLRNLLVNAYERDEIKVFHTDHLHDDYRSVNAIFCARDIQEYIYKTFDIINEITEWVSD